MPLIPPQRKPDRQPLSVKVDARLLTLLKAYTTFIASGLEYVVNEAVLVTFTADRDFQAWLAAERPHDWQAFKALREEHRAPATARRPASIPAAFAGPAATEMVGAVAAATPKA